MSEAVSDSQAAKDQADLINDLESLLAMCNVRRQAKDEKLFAFLMLAAAVTAICAFIGIAFVSRYSVFGIMLAAICCSVGMCFYPVPPTMTKEECAQVFSRFNHLPGRDALLERYAQYGTLSYEEVKAPLREALYKLRMAQRKAEIMELANDVKEIPSKAV